MRTRAERIHALLLKKKKAKKLYPSIEHGKYANHLAKCSCYMCGNPRRYFGEKTIQEKKHDEAFKDMFD